MNLWIQKLKNTIEIQIVFDKIFSILLVEKRVVLKKDAMFELYQY